MYPQFGRSLEFDPKIAKQFEKAEKIVNDIEWDFSKLTEEDKRFFKQIGYDYETDEYAVWYYNSGAIGCSWYCGGWVDSISASSYLKSNRSTINYLPQNAHNETYKTAWVEGVEGYGIGEYITYHFSWNNPRITTIHIANGYVKSEQAYRENSRVKKLKMYINDKPIAILNLEDRRVVQFFGFEPIGMGKMGLSDNEHQNQDWTELEKLPDWTIKFEIIEVYPGDKYDDTAITEISFDGIDVHCFGAGTQILMSDNSLKNIELIQAGDAVKSYDFENEKLMDSKVTRLVSATHSNLLKLKFADNEIITTADHPFWTERNVWSAVNAEKANGNYFQETKVESLSVGDKIFIPGKNIFSEIIEIKNINGRQMTYTIELSESDNFIANGMLVKTEIAK
ncbi:MAG: hypothetical protein LBE91_19100 [Tannerella sp.]|nr:hypothetical protein [Tannerella sp.]